MIKLILCGCNGYMGRVVTDLVSEDTKIEKDTQIEIVAGIDVDTQQHSKYPVYTDPKDFTGDADVVLDFSNPSALEGLIDYCTAKKIPLILCATGYSPEQLKDIEKASGQIPVFRSGNMSLGINLLIDLIERACAVLGEDFDVEIVERHHRRKVDAPSGTAIMLADAAAGALPNKPDYVFERESTRNPRSKNEIGISAVRGGTIIGMHNAIFAGQDEVIELSHTAASRDVFATGAIKAVRFIVKKPAGMYNMKDVLC